MLTNETLIAIKQRRSTRAFKDEQIKDDELQAVIEAGTWAPSARNQQAWHFTVIQDKQVLTALNQETKKAALQLDNEYIRQAASNENFNIFYGAPTLIVVSGDEKAMVIDFDCAAANQNMLLAAHSVGLGSCWINFVMLLFNSPGGEKHIKQLGLPAGYKPYCSVALGYKKADTAAAPPRKEGIVNYIR
ncbi:MAG: nitroreductase [Negativicutes bacterium]|nr:nitroreductase [Negativicutes bacterium]